MSYYSLSKIEEAVENIREGGLVIVADNEDRENEGDLICAAEKVTPSIINFMATHARGLICMPISLEIANRLELELMTYKSKDDKETAFTMSIDGAVHRGVGTGISVADRAKTIQICLEKDSTAKDLRIPGHIFPLIAKKGGVIVRGGQTEASIDLCKLAGLKEAGVICEILNPDGTMAKRDELYEFSRKFKVPFITVEQIQNYRAKTENLLGLKEESFINTKHGKAKIMVFEELFDLECQHLAVLLGDINSLQKNTLVKTRTGDLVKDVLLELLKPDLERKFKTFREDLDLFFEKVVSNSSKLSGVFIYQTTKLRDSTGLNLTSLVNQNFLKSENSLKTEKNWVTEQILRSLGVTSTKNLVEI